jgi:hypothetical protein
MHKITIFKGVQVLMVLFAIFEVYVAYVSPAMKGKVTFVIFSLVCMNTFVMLKRRIDKLKPSSLSSKN